MVIWYLTTVSTQYSTEPERFSDSPKDNPEIEKFNEILEYEWLHNFNLSLNPGEFNSRLTEWLIEYEFNRPHQSLAYLTPVEYIEKELAKIRNPVLPLWSASTRR